MSPKVVVVGGGFSGCAAAIAAAKVGAEVLLLERTDMLSGAGLRAGRMNYNGKLVAAEEAKALGAGEVFGVLESIMLHRENIIDEEHGYVCDVIGVDPAMRQAVEVAGVKTMFESLVVDVSKDKSSIKTIKTESGEVVEGDAFVDTTGSSGGIDQCTRHGKGCVMCMCRCYIFGNRVSIATKAGAPELALQRPGGIPGRVSPAVAVFKQTLSPDLRKRLEKEKAISIPLPKELVDYSKEDNFRGCCSRRQLEHINLVDIGPLAECVGLGFMPLADIRKIPGFEEVQYDHPKGAGKFNIINNLSITPREDSLKVKGLSNLFVAGEKSGQGGIGEAIATGALAGCNAARVAAGEDPIVLPRTTAIGDLIAFVAETLEAPGGLEQGISMGHGIYFDRMKQLDLYSKSPPAIHDRIKKLGLTGILAKKVTK